MKILTKKESDRIAAALLQMQDVIDRFAMHPDIYETLTAGIRDIAKAAGKDTEFGYAVGVTKRVYGR